MDRVVNVHEAKTHFSGLLARVEAGEEIIIGRSGKRVAKLTPLVAKGSQRAPGSARGQVVMAPDFDAPLPVDVSVEFER